MLMRLLPLLILAPATLAADAVPARAPKDALQGFNNLIGTWKGTGTPSAGTRAERDKGFWVETIRWQWQFKGKDAWLVADIEKGKHFTRFELRYRPKPDRRRVPTPQVRRPSQRFRALHWDAITTWRLPTFAPGGPGH